MEGEALACAKKNAHRRKAWIVFQDESGVSQRPPVRRTWAPRGETPVLEHFFNWKKLSISAVLCYHWMGMSTRLLFQLREGSYDTETLIEFLEGLRHELRGEKALLIWDGLPAHKSREMKGYIAKQRKWLVVEQLPGYAPDLNPVELLWGNVKGRELANRCVDVFSELEAAVKAGLRRVGRSMKLAFSFLRHVGLSF